MDKAVWDKISVPVGIYKAVWKEMIIAWIVLAV
jgi:hypothetical protein